MKNSKSPLVRVTLRSGQVIGISAISTRDASTLYLILCNGICSVQKELKFEYDSIDGQKISPTSLYYLVDSDLLEETLSDILTACENLPDDQKGFALTPIEAPGETHQQQIDYLINLTRYFDPHHYHWK